MIESGSANTEPIKKGIRKGISKRRERIRALLKLNKADSICGPFLSPLSNLIKNNLTNLKVALLQRHLANNATLFSPSSSFNRQRILLSN